MEKLLFGAAAVLALLLVPTLVASIYDDVIKGWIGVRVESPGWAAVRLHGPARKPPDIRPGRRAGSYVAERRSGEEPVSVELVDAHGDSVVLACGALVSGSRSFVVTQDQRCLRGPMLVDLFHWLP